MIHAAGALTLIVMSSRPKVAAPPRRTAPSRFDSMSGLQTRLQRLEDHANGLGLEGYTRSGLIRDAVAAYLAPLIDLLDREGGLGQSNDDWFTSGADGEMAFGDALRVRLDYELVDRLDRVEAYARGLGYRHVTRSRLIRDAVSAFLTGLTGTFRRSPEASAVRLGFEV